MDFTLLIYLKRYIKHHQKFLLVFKKLCGEYFCTPDTGEGKLGPSDTETVGYLIPPPL